MDSNQGGKNSDRKPSVTSPRPASQGNTRPADVRTLFVDIITGP